jgi:hypothetical protein
MQQKKRKLSDTKSSQNIVTASSNSSKSSSHRESSDEDDEESLSDSSSSSINNMEDSYAKIRDTSIQEDDSNYDVHREALEKAQIPASELFNPDDISFVSDYGLTLREERKFLKMKEVATSSRSSSRASSRQTSPIKASISPQVSIVSHSLNSPRNASLLSFKQELDAFVPVDPYGNYKSADDLIDEEVKIFNEKYNINNNGEMDNDSHHMTKKFNESANRMYKDGLNTSHHSRTSSNVSAEQFLSESEDFLMEMSHVEELSRDVRNLTSRKTKVDKLSDMKRSDDFEYPLDYQRNGSRLVEDDTQQAYFSDTNSNRRQYHNNNNNFITRRKLNNNNRDDTNDGYYSDYVHHGNGNTNFNRYPNSLTEEEDILINGQNSYNDLMNILASPAHQLRGGSYKMDEDDQQMILPEDIDGNHESHTHQRDHLRPASNKKQQKAELIARIETRNKSHRMNRATKEGDIQEHQPHIPPSELRKLISKTYSKKAKEEHQPSQKKNPVYHGAGGLAFNPSEAFTLSGLIEKLPKQIRPKSEQVKIKRKKVAPATTTTIHRLESPRQRADRKTKDEHQDSGVVNRENSYVEDDTGALDLSREVEQFNSDPSSDNFDYSEHEEKLTSRSAALMERSYSNPLLSSTLTSLSRGRNDEILGFANRPGDLDDIFSGRNKKVRFDGGGSSTTESFDHLANHKSIKRKDTPIAPRVKTLSKYIDSSSDDFETDEAYERDRVRKLEDKVKELEKPPLISNIGSDDDGLSDTGSTTETTGKLRPHMSPQKNDLYPTSLSSYEGRSAKQKKTRMDLIKELKYIGTSESILDSVLKANRSSTSSIKGSKKKSTSNSEKSSKSIVDEIYKNFKKSPHAHLYEQKLLDNSSSGDEMTVEKKRPRSKKSSTLNKKNDEKDIDKRIRDLLNKKGHVSSSSTTSVKEKKRSKKKESTTVPVSTTSKTGKPKAVDIVQKMENEELQMFRKLLDDGEGDEDDDDFFEERRLMQRISLLRSYVDTNK